MAVAELAAKVDKWAELLAESREAGTRQVGLMQMIHEAVQNQNQRTHEHIQGMLDRSHEQHSERAGDVLPTVEGTIGAKSASQPERGEHVTELFEPLEESADGGRGRRLRGCRKKEADP